LWLQNINPKKANKKKMKMTNHAKITFHASGSVALLYPTFSELFVPSFLNKNYRVFTSRTSYRIMNQK